MDWADEKAKEICEAVSVKGFMWHDTPFQVAQALRDVERETAEECVVIVRGLVGDEIVTPWQEKAIVSGIRERFNLEDE